MLLRTRDIPEGHSFISGPAILDPERAGFAITGDVPCRAEADRLNSRIQLRVWYQASMELRCSRCLEPFSSSVHGDFPLVLDEGSEGAPSESVDFWYDDEKPDVNIGSAILDEILMTVPMKPLCSPGCPGIDLGGKGLEKREAREPACHDPRWDALKKLKRTDPQEP